MKKLIFVALIIMASAIIIVSFFMPWVAANTSVTRVSNQLTSSAGDSFRDVPILGKIISGMKETTNIARGIGDIDINAVVSGYNIPKMLNNQSSKIAFSFAQSFFGDVKDLDKKSMLVYLMPLFAIICVILAIIGMRYKASIALMLIISGVISLGGLYNLNTMNLSSEVMAVSIEKGLWYTMYGYLFISILSIAWLIFEFLPILKATKQKGGIK